MINKMVNDLFEKFGEDNVIKAFTAACDFNKAKKILADVKITISDDGKTTTYEGIPIDLSNKHGWIIDALKESFLTEEEAKDYCEKQDKHDLALKPVEFSFLSKAMNAATKSAAEIIKKEIAKPKPKKTKIEFVKCEFNHAWEAVKMHFEEGLYTEDNKMLLLNKQIVPRFERGDVFYRKVETEITWQDEVKGFLDKCEEISGKSQLEVATWKSKDSSDDLWDKEFIEMCNIVVNATK